MKKCLILFFLLILPSAYYCKSAEPVYSKKNALRYYYLAYKSLKKEHIKYIEYYILRSVDMNQIKKIIHENKKSIKLFIKASKMRIIHDKKIDYHKQHFYMYRISPLLKLMQYKLRFDYYNNLKKNLKITVKSFFNCLRQVNIKNSNIKMQVLFWETEIYKLILKNKKYIGVQQLVRDYVKYRENKYDILKACYRDLKASMKVIIKIIKTKVKNKIHQQLLIKKAGKIYKNVKIIIKKIAYRTKRNWKEYKDYVNSIESKIKLKNKSFLEIIQDAMKKKYDTLFLYKQAIYLLTTTILSVQDRMIEQYLISRDKNTERIKKILDKK